MYGNDLELYRDIEDQFVYIYDDMDEVNTRINVDKLKVIILNVATKKVEDEFELDELEKFLNTHEDIN